MTQVQTTQTWNVPGISGARVIEVENLPARLAGAVRLGPGLEARPGAVLITVPQIARYLVTNGVAIEVASTPRADPAAVELFLDTAARAALIHERGELPLLSTTIVSPSGECVALCGGTGVGKSAVAAVLIRRGWSLSAEGVTRITLEGREAFVQPTHEALRLWRDTCELLKIDPAGMRRTRAAFKKYYVPVGSTQTSVRLGSIIRLRPDPKVFGPMPEVSNRKLLENNTYVHPLAAALAKTVAYERIANAILEQCRFAIVDGAHAASLDELADRIERCCRER
jgi:hypothetical protein